MLVAELRFHDMLNDLLPRGLRGTAFPVRFRLGDTVKNLIEACGVPHTEVGVVTADAVAVPPAYHVRDGDRVSVCPVSLAAEGDVESSWNRIEPGAARFILDVHLGALARALRTLGLDTAWEPPFDDGELAARAAVEGRVLLTRDRALLMRKLVTHGCLVRSLHPQAQVEEVLRRFRLQEKLRPFTRCLSCNAPLEELPAAEARPLVPELVAQLYDGFRRCPSCRKVYWKGTHWQDMARRLVDPLTRVT